MIQNDPIVALATPSGVGAIAVIRISGEQSIAIVSKFFKSIRGKDLQQQKTHTVHLGHIVNDGKILDEVLLKVSKKTNLPVDLVLYRVFFNLNTFVEVPKNIKFYILL